MSDAAPSTTDKASVNAGDACHSSPTFLGIGGQRCGTTWLHHALAQHPAIHVPTAKEVHFFNREIVRRDLRWYLEQVAPTEDAPAKPIRGEITPAYSTLPRGVVNAIARLWPALKLIWVIRHPVERAWSQAMLEFGLLKDRAITQPPTTRFLAYFERPRVKMRNDYLRTYRIWRDAFGEDALHVSLYDDLQADPRQHLVNILRHLGADVSALPSDETLSERRWSSQGVEPPPVFQWYLARQWLDTMRRLNEAMGGRLDAWVADLRELSAPPSPTWRMQRLAARHVLDRLGRERERAVMTARNVQLRYHARTLASRSMGDASRT